MFEENKKISRYIRRIEGYIIVKRIESFLKIKKSCVEIFRELCFMDESQIQEWIMEFIIKNSDKNTILQVFLDKLM